MKVRNALLIGCLTLTAVAAQAAEPAPAKLTEQTEGSGAPRAPEQENVVFEHADLQFRVHPARRSIDGDAALTFRASAPVKRVVLDLDSNFDIDLVAVDGKTLPASAYANPEGRLTITLPQPLASGERTVVRVRYSGQPHVAVRAPWDGGFVWSTAPTGEPWIASAVQGEGCDLFWPCIDHPQGEPLQVDQHVSVPAPLVAAGNGIAMGMDERDGWRTYHWRIKNPNTYAIALNIGPYELLADDYRSRYGNTIPLRFWYLRGNEDQARVLFTEFPRMLDFFEATIGPYPFGDEKMGVVETPHKGMEHQTINAYGNHYVKTAFGFDELLQHELAHEWFGNQLTNTNWDDMWLHEGFGSYMQPLYLEYLHGDMAYDAELHRQRGSIVNQHPIVSGKPQRESDVYDNESGPGGDIYVKGSLVLHTLRGLIGDEAFLRATRKLVYGTDTPRPGNFAPRYADTSDFIAAVNEATGRDYGWFFDVYLYQAALPKLVATRDADHLTLRWNTPANLPFPMPVDIRIDGREQTLPMADGKARVELPEHALYTLDPHSKVLRDQPHVGLYQADKKAREQVKAEKAKADAAGK